MRIHSGLTDDFSRLISSKESSLVLTVPSRSASKVDNTETMVLQTGVGVFVLLVLGCLSGSYGRPARPFDEQEDQDELIGLLKRILEQPQVERELELSQQEWQERERRTEMKPRVFLERFGYLPALPRNVSHSPVSMKAAIMKFQQMYHLKETGDMNDKTVEMMQMPRCGMPDSTPKEYLELMRSRANSISDLNSQLKAQNYYVPGYKWKKTELKWRLKNYHRLLSQKDTKNAFRQAFKYWSDVTGLKFTETDSDADINMAFARGDHGDGSQNSFDGSGMVLAHAFYPESGEVHYDEDEHWSEGKNEGSNLRIVATHELGHALGLGHSNVQGAVMAPYYQGYEVNFKLRPDDVSAIQSLYGPPGGPQNPPVQTATKEPTRPTQPSSGGPPNTCEVVYEAITQTHDYRIYVFNGRWMWRTSEYGMDNGFPVTISTYYKDPPEDISAAIFSWETRHTYFFKNNKIWKYYGFYIADTKVVETQGYPENPKAAIASKDGKTIYLLKDGYAWKFNENTLDISATENPISIQVLFPGAPSDFDSAVRLDKDPHIYFFQGQNYYKYSEDERKVLNGYPSPKAGPWMGPTCGASPYTPK